VTDRPAPLPRRAVLKIGGSVLTGAAAYRRAARIIGTRLAERPDERILAIVSAEEGLTDALLATARDIVCDPDPDTLDLLWSTGEHRSVALLVLALQAAGISAVAANVHQTGLIAGPGGRARGTGGEAWTPWRTRQFRTLRLRSLLASADVVVAPGFLARAAGDRIRSLGRGGSDLTAVLLAAGLEAVSCELLKDVPGYFTADPRAAPDAEPIDALPYDAAIAMAERGCGLVQLAALEAARDLNVRLVVRGLDGGTGTVVA
jgi:aspartate kinase